MIDPTLVNVTVVPAEICNSAGSNPKSTIRTSAVYASGDEGVLLSSAAEVICVVTVAVSIGIDGCVVGRVVTWVASIGEVVAIGAVVVAPDNVVCGVAVASSPPQAASHTANIGVSNPNTSRRAIIRRYSFTYVLLNGDDGMERERISVVHVHAIVENDRSG